MNSRVSVVVLALLALGLLLFSLRYWQGPARSAFAPEQGQKLDLNRASFKELLRLPGIGPRLALRILSYREEHGRFSSLEELLNVKGIGPALLERLREHLTVTP